MQITITINTVSGKIEVAQETPPDTQKLSQNEIARRMGVSQAYLSQLRHGVRSWTPQRYEQYRALTGESPVVCTLSAGELVRVKCQAGKRSLGKLGMIGTVLQQTGPGQVEVLFQNGERAFFSNLAGYHLSKYTV